MLLTPMKSSFLSILDKNFLALLSLQTFNNAMCEYIYTCRIHFYVLSILTKTHFSGPFHGRILILYGKFYLAWQYLQQILSRRHTGKKRLLELQGHSMKMCDTLFSTEKISVSAVQNVNEQVAKISIKILETTSWNNNNGTQAQKSLHLH